MMSDKSLLRSLIESLAEIDRCASLLVEERDVARASLDACRAEVAALAAQNDNLERALNKAVAERHQAVGLSKIAPTTCAGCSQEKWCPWREDEGGLGYICAGCLAKKRDEACAALQISRSETATEKRRADLAEAVAVLREAEGKVGYALRSERESRGSWDHHEAELELWRVQETVEAARAAVAKLGGQP